MPQLIDSAPPDASTPRGSASTWPLAHDNKCAGQLSEAKRSFFCQCILLDLAYLATDVSPVRDHLAVGVAPVEVVAPRHRDGLQTSYVDSQGGSFIGFGITRLLGFDLIARFKQIRAVKLYPRAGRAVLLRPALTRPIRPEITERNYDLRSNTRWPSEVCSLHPELFA